MGRQNFAKGVRNNLNWGGHPENEQVAASSERMTMGWGGEGGLGFNKELFTIEKEAFFEGLQVRESS